MKRHHVCGNHDHVPGAPIRAGCPTRYDFSLPEMVGQWWRDQAFVVSKRARVDAYCTLAVKNASGGSSGSPIEDTDLADGLD